MNIFLLCGTQTAYLAASLLVKQLPVKGIIGLEDSAANRRYHEYFDYAACARQWGVEYLPLASYTMRDDADKALLLLQDIDLILVCSWQRLVPAWLISHCRVGIVGFHGSPLGISAGRGRSPQNWALLLGCPQFTCSIFWLDDGVDSGSIIATQSFTYTPTDDIFSSYVKADLAMVQMLVASYQNGWLAQKAGSPQKDEGSQYLPQRTSEDGLMDWNRSSGALYNFVRALGRPYPGAQASLPGGSIRVWRAQPVDAAFPGCEALAPGQVITAYPSGELLVQCKKGQLIISDFSFEGTPFPIEAGQVFTSACYSAQMKAIVERHREKYSFPVSQLVLREIEDENAGGSSGGKHG